MKELRLSRQICYRGGRHPLGLAEGPESGVIACGMTHVPVAQEMAVKTSERRSGRRIGEAGKLRA